MHDSQGRPNVVLLTAEQLRADLLDWPKLTAGGVLCKSVFSSATSSEFALAGLMSGQHPIRVSTKTGAISNDLPFGVTMLPELFLGAGYTTCAFGNLRRENHWFGKGFEFYIDPGLRHGRNATWRETNAIVVPWLRANSSEHFFLNVHYRSETEPGALESAVQELVSTLADLRLGGKTLVVFTTACGEAGGFHDRDLRVPLLFFWPGRLSGGTLLNAMFQTEDIAPTLLEAAGLALPSGLDGQSFWKELAGEAQPTGRDRTISVDCSSPEHASLRSSEFRLILDESRIELYDLLQDPQEEQNVGSAKPDKVSELSAGLTGWVSARLEERTRNEELFSEVF